MWKSSLHQDPEADPTLLQVFFYEHYKGFFPSDEADLQQENRGGIETQFFDGRLGSSSLRKKVSRALRLIGVMRQIKRC